VPLDNRLQLPESQYSYLLQDWAQALAVEQSYGQVGQVLDKMLGLKLSVSALERMNGALAEGVEPYWEATLAQPSAAGEFLVASADGKGVVIRKAAASAPIQAHDHRCGPKPDRKKMAILGALYDSVPYERTPQQVWPGLFGLPTAVNDDDREPRPQPIAKALRASLTHIDAEGALINARTTIFGWLGTQVQQRDPEADKALVVLMDGQHGLWEDAAEAFAGRQRVEILDLLHATSKLWDLVQVFHPSGSAQALDAMKLSTLMLLQGGVKHLIVWFRHWAEVRELPAGERQRVEGLCTYFANHQERMRYDQYLAQGYPIASGVIEGACRHGVKDRLERSGMHWSIAGAQALRNLRCVALNGQWDEFTDYRIQRETARLYPDAARFQRIDWPLAVAA
jgi:hypothetical protein